MSRQDATTRAVIWVTSPQPALLDREAVALRRLRQGVLDLVCRFDQVSGADASRAAWHAFAEHRLRWVKVRQSMERRLVRQRSFGICDPDVGEAHALTLLRRAGDPDDVLFSAGSWWAAILDGLCSARVETDAADDPNQALEAYLAAVLDRETDIQSRLAGHCRLAVLEWQGDLDLAATCRFEHVDWAPAPGGGRFLLVVRVHPEARVAGPSQRRDIA